MRLPTVLRDSFEAMADGDVYHYRTSYVDEHEKKQIVVHFSTQKFDVGDLIPDLNIWVDQVERAPAVNVAGLLHGHLRRMNRP